MNIAADRPGNRFEELQEEVREIARVLLKEHPTGTPMRDVWEEALSLHRVRYETESLPGETT